MRLQFAEPRNVIQCNNGRRQGNGGGTVWVSSRGAYRVHEKVPKLSRPALQGERHMQHVQETTEGNDNLGSANQTISLCIFL